MKTPNPNSHHHRTVGEKQAKHKKKSRPKFRPISWLPWLAGCNHKLKPRAEEKLRDDAGEKSRASASPWRHGGGGVVVVVENSHFKKCTTSAIFLLFLLFFTTVIFALPLWRAASREGKTRRFSFFRFSRDDDDVLDAPPRNAFFMYCLHHLHKWRVVVNGLGRGWRCRWAK